VEEKPTAKVEEEVKQIAESRNARQKDKHPLWEVFRTLLLSMTSAFAIFFIEILLKNN